jgi:hypothetical protein
MPTKAELQRQLVRVSREASAYQEAFWALQRGETPVRLHSGERHIELLAPHRHCGGVVVQGCHVVFADAWVAMVDQYSEPYLQDLARQVRRAQSDAFTERLAEAPPAAVSLRIVGGAS